MSHGTFGTAYLPLIACLGLAGACSTNNGTTTGSTSETTTGSTSSATGSTSDSTAAPTTTSATESGSGTIGESASGSTTGTTDPGSSTTGTTQGVDTTSTTGTTDTTDTTSTGTTTGTSTTDASSTGSSSSSTTEPGCMPLKEVCNDLDDDCDGFVDNVDAGGDGICDCLNIAILGATGFAPNANFEAWLTSQGTGVTRTKLLNNPGVVTPAFLDKYDLVLLDRIERALSPEEAKALETFIKTEGRGMITLIGYNFDNNNPAPERDRANTALAPFGLAYEGAYFGAAVPTFDQNHPVSKGIFDVNFLGGIKPIDTGKQGMSTVFSNLNGVSTGIAHQTANMGGRVVVWGDEWITFDSDWQGFADVQDFWVNMVNWARPQDFCTVPQ